MTYGVCPCCPECQRPDPQHAPQCTQSPNARKARARAELVEAWNYTRRRFQRRVKTPEDVADELDYEAGANGNIRSVLAWLVRRELERL